MIKKIKKQNYEKAHFIISSFNAIYYIAKMLIHIQGLEQFGVSNYIINESNGMSNIDGLNHNYLHCKVFNLATNSYQYYRSYQNSGTLKINLCCPPKTRQNIHII